LVIGKLLSVLQIQREVKQRGCANVNAEKEKLFRQVICEIIQVKVVGALGKKNCRKETLGMEWREHACMAFGTI